MDLFKFSKAAAAAFSEEALKTHCALPVQLQTSDIQSLWLSSDISLRS